MDPIKGRPILYVLIALLMVSVLLTMVSIEMVKGAPSTHLVVEWNKTFGGPGRDDGFSVQQTSDGGYIITGYTTSYRTGKRDVWLIKTDANGNKEWDKTFGGPGDDEGWSVQQTSDGGYIIVGMTTPYGSNHDDVWLIKTDANGNMMWNKTFGGPDSEWAYSVQQTSDGGYIITGMSGGNIWLIKTDANGNMVWNKTFDDLNDDRGWSVRQTSDGGYIIVGDTFFYGGNCDDVRLIKTDANGNEQWNRTFGGPRDDEGYSVQQTSDGGYIIVGMTISYGTGEGDVWLIKTDANGNMMWNKTFGGPGEDWGHSIQQTSDGGYIIVGKTTSYGAHYGDVWLIKTDANGNMVWNKTVDCKNMVRDKAFDGSKGCWGHSIQQTSDGGYIIAGGIRYYEMMDYGLITNYDVLLVKVGEKELNETTSSETTMTPRTTGPSKTNSPSETPAKPSTTTGSGGGGICGPGIIIALATAPLLFKRRRKGRCNW